MQSLAPFFLIIGFYLNPFRIVLLIPVYCYGLQLIWVLSPEHSDNFLGYLFAFGICVLFIFLIYLLNKMNDYFGSKRSQDEEFINEARDVLDMLKSKMVQENLNR